MMLFTCIQMVFAICNPSTSTIVVNFRLFLLAVVSKEEMAIIVTITAIYVVSFRCFLVTVLADVIDTVYAVMDRLSVTGRQSSA